MVINPGDYGIAAAIALRRTLAPDLALDLRRDGGSMVWEAPDRDTGSATAAVPAAREFDQPRDICPAIARLRRRDPASAARARRVGAFARRSQLRLSGAAFWSWLAAGLLAS